MKLFVAFRKKRALKKYALKLPGRLRSDYGASEYFSPAEIKVAAQKLKLNPELIAYAFAAFLPEEIFAQESRQFPNPPSYKEARNAFFRYVPPQPPSEEGGYYESGLGMGGWRPQ